MKKDIHPKVKDFKIQFSSKEIFDTKSAGRDSSMVMEIDFRKHHAWTKQGVSFVNESNRDISNFNRKFGDLGIGSPSKK